MTSGFVELNSTGLGIATVLTDSGAPAVTPNGSGEISILGGTGMNVTGNGPGNTVTVTLETPVTVPNGGTGVTTITGVLTGNGGGVITGSPVTQFGVLVGGLSNSVQSTAALTNGQTIIGSTGANGVAGTIGSSDSSITWTLGAGTLTGQVAGGTTVIKTITGDSGGALSPTAGNFNILGSGSITTVGVGSTETVTLTGLTNHAVLVGAGTTTITKVGPTATAGQVLQSAGAAADPAFSTATYPLTTTVSQILYSSAANTVSGLATANRAVLTTGTTGIPVLTAIATDGQIIIGSTVGSPAAATITAGTGISVTNASNSITIAVTGAGFAWTDVTSATQTLAVANGYITDRGGGVVYTLPATASLGDEIIILGKLGLTTIAQNANQSIRLGSSISTVGVGGSFTGTNLGDCITLSCTTLGASTVWAAQSSVGNWAVA